jgi:hypothetical protein
MAVAAWAVSGSAAAAGVLGGGLLIGISYYAIGTSTTALVALISPETPQEAKRRVARVALLKLAGRYALLGFLAYVMIARLRLHPVGLLAGASSVAAAAFVEAVRFLAGSGSRPLR